MMDDYEIQMIKLQVYYKKKILIQKNRKLLKEILTQKSHAVYVMKSWMTTIIQYIVNLAAAEIYIQNVWKDG